MNNRILLIITSLALPLVVVGIIGSQVQKSHTAKQNAGANSNAAGSVKRVPQKLPATLEEARSYNKKRLNELERMTPEQWKTEQPERYYTLSTDLEKARIHVRQRLAQLDAMSQQEWDAEVQKRDGNKNKPAVKSQLPVGTAPRDKPPYTP